MNKEPGGEMEIEKKTHDGPAAVRVRVRHDGAMHHPEMPQSLTHLIRRVLRAGVETVSKIGAWFERFVDGLPPLVVLIGALVACMMSFYMPLWLYSLIPEGIWRFAALVAVIVVVGAHGGVSEWITQHARKPVVLKEGA